MYYKSEDVLEPPPIPLNFSATEQYNKLFMPRAPQFNVDHVELDQIGGVSVRDRLKTLLAQLLTHSVSPCLVRGEPKTNEEEAKLNAYIDEIYGILKALRKRQALQRFAVELRGQIEDLERCEVDLKEALTAANTLIAESN